MNRWRLLMDLRHSTSFVLWWYECVCVRVCVWSHPTITFVKRSYHVQQPRPSITPINHIHQSHPSITPINHIHQSHPSITSINHIHQSHVIHQSHPSITPVNHTHQSHPSITPINHIHQSHPSITSINHRALCPFPPRWGCGVGCPPSPAHSLHPKKSRLGFENSPKT